MYALSTALLSEGSIIDLDWTVSLQFVIFAVAFVVLRPLIFKPMIALFEAREASIRGARLDAQRLQTEAAEAGESFDEEMRKLRTQALAERDRLRDEGKKLEATLLERVKAETDAQLEEAAAHLLTRSKELRSSLEEEIPTLARQIAARLLNREVKG